MHEDGNLEPKWNYTFVIPVKNIYNSLELDVRDKETVGSDRSICKFQTHVNEMIQGKVDKWWDLKHNDDEVGKIHLKIEWKPSK